MQITKEKLTTQLRFIASDGISTYIVKKHDINLKICNKSEICIACVCMCYVRVKTNNNLQRNFSIWFGNNCLQKTSMIRIFEEYNFPMIIFSSGTKNSFLDVIFTRKQNFADLIVDKLLCFLDACILPKQNLDDTICWIKYFCLLRNIFSLIK
jgi:hypothetical protein